MKERKVRDMRGQKERTGSQGIWNGAPDFGERMLCGGNADVGGGEVRRAEAAKL